MINGFVKEVTTERLLINHLYPGDAYFIRELVNTDGWLKFIGDRNVKSEEAAQDYIDKILKRSDVHYLVVRLIENCTPIGIISFLKRDWLDNYDIGFAFLHQYCRMGYAFESTQTIIKLISNIYPIILAVTKEGNVPSIKLLNKLGFQYQSIVLQGEDYLSVYKYFTE